MRETPPLYTVAGHLVCWTLDRRADFPKSQRFTFGQRVDNLSLDCLQPSLSSGYHFLAQGEVMSGALLLK